MASLKAAAQGRPTIADLGAVAGALAVSVVLAWLITGDAMLALALAAGLVVLGLAAQAALRHRPLASADGFAATIDWSLTLAALEQAGLAVAVTDRANRLVCATSAYQEFFATQAPPRLELGELVLEQLTQLARNAWREGSSGEGTFDLAGRRWTVEARSAGAAEHHLVWLLRPESPVSPARVLDGQLEGILGQALGRAGIAAALIAADGTLRAANAAFALSTSGTETASLSGEPFAPLLRSDEQERIFFAREGRQGAPQILLQVPLDDPAAAEPTTGENLILLFARGAGHGGGDAGATASVGAAQLEALVERLPLGLAAVGRDGRLLYANPAFRRASGIDRQGRTGRLPPFPSDLVARGDKGALADVVRRYCQGNAASGDITLRLQVSPDEPVSLGLTGVRGLGEVAMLLSLADMTEENRLKRQVAQATKMQAVGQLAGGVAHDFNNVLTAIIGTCDLMLERHAAGDGDYDDIQQIRANSNRAASLTRQLLAFSRQQTLKPEIIHLPDVLSEMMHLLQRLLGARIAIEVSHERDLAPVRADPRQLEQVIMNLAVNARDAIQERGGGEHAAGTLSFATSSMDAAAIRALGNEVIPDNDYTVLTVDDTGGGIPRRVMGKIFEPFFTTKEQGKGTGLGLSTVYGIVKQSGGFIFAENRAGSGGSGGGGGDPGGTIAGARFTFFLPAYQATSEELARLRQPAEPPPSAARDWSGGGRILLVEDEDMVRAVAERALVRAGYAVVTASDGEEGLVAFRAGQGSGAHFDLVISDVVMPGIDGPAMARTIREEAPEVPVLFMSGYAEAQLRDELDLSAVHFIAKPFSVREITDKVGEVLAERREVG